MSSPQHVRRFVIKASAGTGKTHNLTNYYLGCLGCEPQSWKERDRATFALEGAPCRPEEVIAVTFTRKAAAELKDRFRKALLDEGRYEEAARVEGSLIGTVHSVCLRLLQEYALDAGISPVAEELSEEDAPVLFRRAAAPLMEKFAYLNDLFYEFGIDAGFSGQKKDRSQAMLDFCRDIIAMARTNGLDSRLEALGAQSFASVLGLMDRICPAAADDGAELDAMRRELAALVEVQKEKERYEHSGKLSKEEKARGEKKLSSYEESHWNFMKRLPAPSVMRWKDWLGLLCHDTGKNDLTLQGYVEECTALGRRVFGLKAFRNDVERLVTGMFSFAACAMARFSTAKQDAGVVDFADMERMAREALRDPRVRERMKGRFRVLFVDEFQDTSPIQLSIFRLLGQLVHGTAEAPGRIIYVGDDKQSIYSFRGAAPDLTRNCTPRPLWEERPLETCWRSLPELCRFTSHFFSQVPEPWRSSLLGGPGPDSAAPALAVESVLSTRDALPGLHRSLSDIEPLRFWLTGVSASRLPRADAFASLARNIAELCGRVDAEGRILSRADENRAARVSRIAKLGSRKGEFGTRPALPGDIAVLCRSNDDCVAIADALEALGIPAAARREGLLEQEDAAFCLNAFRLVLDPGDKLAATELHLALNGGDAWFEAARKQRGEPGSLWEGIPFMAGIESLHKRLALLTPAEVLDETLSLADCFRRAAAKSRHEERFADLEALRALVREYEKAMHSRRASATAQGWLDWLKENESGRASGGQDAVQVWTYHRSKGLERKIVILHSLSDRRPNIDVFKPRVFSTGELAADADPLDDRTLEWIPNVFHRAVRLPEVEETFTALKETLEQERTEEAQRLLYVGMTRACDVLVFSADLADKGRAVTSSWLFPFLCEAPEKIRKNDVPALRDLNAAEDGSTAVFCDTAFRVRRTIDIQPAEWASARQEEGEKRFPRAVGMPEPRPCAEAAPVTSRWLPDFRGAHVDVSGIAPEAPRDQLGNMLHGWFAVWFGMDREQREAERASGRLNARLERFCRQWNRPCALWKGAEAHLPALGDALEQAVQDWFEGRPDQRPGDELLIRTEWPLEHRLDEGANGLPAFRLDAMRVDLMAEVRRADGSPGPCLILDHKCGRYAHLSAEALKEHLTEAYGPRQSDYVRALRATGRDCECRLHLPLEGRMLIFCLPEAPGR